MRRVDSRIACERKRRRVGAEAYITRSMELSARFECVVGAARQPEVTAVPLLLGHECVEVPEVELAQADWDLADRSRTHDARDDVLIGRRDRLAIGVHEDG